MSINKDILKTLTYFDIFLYPLDKKELFSFLQNHYNTFEFDSAIEGLLYSKMIFEVHDFLCLHNNISLAHRRVAGNHRAKKLLKIAEKVGVLISWFPFVKSVGVSGSLSKNFAAENDDIDLFIIATKNRLWLARSILFFFRRITRLFNKENWFCMNYFIDEEMLEIPEKTIYSAIEIETLLPLQGLEVFDSFLTANTWTKSFLPNVKRRTPSYKQTKGSPIKWMVERLLNNSLGDKLDNFLLHTTAKRLQTKEELLKQNSRGMLVIEKHVSRHDPKVFQQTFLLKYESKVAEVLKKYEEDVVEKLRTEQGY